MFDYLNFGECRNSRRRFGSTRLERETSRPRSVFVAAAASVMCVYKPRYAMKRSQGLGVH